MAVNSGQKVGQNSPALAPPGPKADGADVIGPIPPAVCSAHQTRAAQTRIFKGAVQVSNLRMASRPFTTKTICASQKTMKAKSCPSPMPSTGSGDPLRSRPAMTPTSARSVEPPIQVWMPYQPHATRARARAGSLAPCTPNEVRTRTANGTP